MEIVSLGKNVWALRGGVNSGAVAAEGEVVFVDAGLDEGPARRLWRWAEEAGLRPRAAILTHAHADHFGGAPFWESRNLPLYAPPLEAAMMGHPLFEPLFLSCGASPLPQLRTKFTLAPPLHRVEPLPLGPLRLGPLRLEIVPLPGHAPEQIGVRANDVLFCADAVFTPDILAKHPIPFCYDLRQAQQSLNRVEEEGEVVVPGHGAPLRGEEVRLVCQAFGHRLSALVHAAEEALAFPRMAEDLVGLLAQRFCANLDLVGFLLARTTVWAILSLLVQEGRARPFVQEGKLLWQRA